MRRAMKDLQTQSEFVFSYAIHFQVQILHYNMYLLCETVTLNRNTTII